MMMRAQERGARIRSLPLARASRKETSLFVRAMMMIKRPGDDKEMIIKRIERERSPALSMFGLSLPSLSPLPLSSVTENNGL